jgi:pSer/pThr/pTyr-binding forkhead associated (FHA) protein
VARGGAPTGKWETAPKHLETEDDELDIRAADVSLTVRRPGVPEVEIPVEKSAFVIGRLASEVDLVLDDDLVSRKHARLTGDARGYFKLEDLESQNGITFQGRTVRRLNLVDGDTFRIGRTEFIFHAKMDRHSAPPPKATPSRKESEVYIPDPADHHHVPAEPGSGSEEDESE